MNPPSPSLTPSDKPIPSPLPSDSPPERPSTLRDYLGISLFWLALSFFWGALLTIALPAHIETLFGSAGKDAALTRLIASGAAVAGLTQIVFGALSDGSHSKFGRRRPFLFCGTLLAIVPLLLLPSAHSLIALLLAYAALQFAINIAAGPYGALMHDLIPTRDHGTASAWIGVVGLIGRIGGPLVAVILLGRGMNSTLGPAFNAAQSQSNIAALMKTFAVVLVAVMLVTLSLARERPLKATATPRVSLPDRLRSMFSVSLRPYPDFRWLVFSRFGIMMGIYTVSNFLLYYIRDTLGFSNEASLGVLKNFLILSTLAGLVGTFPSNALSKRIGRKRVLYGANVICMAAGLCLALAHNLTLAYIAAAIFGAGYGAFAAVDWALATGLLPPQEPAKYMAVWGLSDIVSQVIAPLAAWPFVVFTNHALGAGLGYRALMIVALIWFFLGTLALRPIRETPPDLTP